MNTTQQQQADDFAASHHVTVLFRKLQERADLITPGDHNAQYQLGYLHSVVHRLAQAQSTTEVQQCILGNIQVLEDLNCITRQKNTKEQIA